MILLVLVTQRQHITRCFWSGSISPVSPFANWGTITQIVIMVSLLSLTVCHPDRTACPLPQNKRMSVRLKAFTRIFFGALGLFGNPEILPGGSGLAQVNFGTPTNIACQSSPKELFIADFNRDGKLDVGSKVSSGVNLLFGFGNGALSDIALKHTNTVGDVMAIGDFNNDGNLDFVLVGLYFTHIILNDGKSGMNFWTNLNGYSVYPSAVAVADFNGDGRLDMVVSTSGTASMCVLINKGNGTFWDPVYYNGRGSDDHISLQAGDFDRDGNLDVAVINANSHSVTIWRNNGNGTFTSANTYALAFAPCSIACADFNCDKKLDLIIRGNSNVVVLLGRGDATFT
ncbi:MAG: VCBS repeat-containing protein, partial [Verrucomicrobiota bacterium]